MTSRPAQPVWLPERVLDRGSLRGECHLLDGCHNLDVATISRFRSACKALKTVGIFTDAGEGRYTVNQAEIALAGAMKGNQ